jgi:8-oxo-dGTP diphosphatase
MKKVAKIILYNKKRVLLQLRDDYPKIPYPNMWSLFGGRIEEGEIPKAALKRELLEEINSVASNIKFICKRVRMEGHNSVEDYIYSGKIPSNILTGRLTEGQQMKFFSISELKNINLAPTYKEIIYKFLED